MSFNGAAPWPGRAPVVQESARPRNLSRGSGTKLFVGSCSRRQLQLRPKAARLIP